MKRNYPFLKVTIPAKMLLNGLFLVESYSFPARMFHNKEQKLDSNWNLLYFHTLCYTFTDLKMEFGKHEIFWFEGCRGGYTSTSQLYMLIEGVCWSYLVLKFQKIAILVGFFRHYSLIRKTYTLFSIFCIYTRIVF